PVAQREHRRGEQEIEREQRPPDNAGDRPPEAPGRNRLVDRFLDRVLQLLEFFKRLIQDLSARAAVGGRMGNRSTRKCCVATTKGLTTIILLARGGHGSNNCLQATEAPRIFAS